MFPVSYIIIGITSLVSIIAFNNRALSNKLIFNAYQVAHRKEIWRMFTNGLIHGGYFHLLVNMWALYLFGWAGSLNFNETTHFSGVELSFVEDFEHLGILYYIILYVGALFISSIPALWKHGNNPSYNSLGASGATSAVVFSCIILHPTMSLNLFFVPIPIPAFVIGIAYLGFESYMNKRKGTGIAHDAHLSGALFGIVFTLFLRPSYGRDFIYEITNMFN
ncbi:MAG: rhomboid family intramembrane serine protease [Bacteroidota bacterium]